MKIKLQTRITLIYALIFTMVLVAMNAAVFLIVRFYNTSSDNISLLKTKNIAESILLDQGAITSRDLLEEGVRFPLVVQVDSGQEQFSSLPDLTVVHEEGMDYFDFYYLGEPGRHRATVIRTEFLGRGQQSFYLTVGKSIEESVYTRRVTLITTSIASFLGMLLSIAVGSYMSHESFQPINNMRRSVESISAKNINERIQVPDNGDELTDLGRTFNNLLDRMETAYAQQRKFVSDASHELRTPITVIRGYVDLLDRWGKHDPEILEEAITSIKSETLDMSHLVENLLFIAKGENRKLNFEPERFNLLELVAEVSNETIMNNETRAIQYSGDSFDIVGDQRMLKQLLRIFIENSSKFTESDGIIRTTVTREDGQAVIKVWDNGDGIAPDDMRRVFERFFVADKARTKDKSGSGLGLSIAKWIVDVHEGEVSLASRVDEFTEFTVRLPLERGQLRGSSASPMPEKQDAKDDIMERTGKAP